MSICTVLGAYKSIRYQLRAGWIIGRIFQLISNIPQKSEK